MIRFFLLMMVVSFACKPKPPPLKRAPTDLATLAKGLPQQPQLELSREAAHRLVQLSLSCVDREYPNKPGNILAGDETVRPPRELTPVFYGCFDWHSAVHGHWTLVRVLATFPDLPQAAQIRETLARHLTPDKLAAELTYFQAERNRLFERPYGWGWLLRLALELHALADPEAQKWRAALAPLADFLARRTADYLARLTVPVRAGTHANTAFALAHMHDYALGTGDTVLAAAIEKRAREFYGRDRACPTDYEPSGEDFISPCLAEADLMRRVLDRDGFVNWLDGFLPPLTSPRFAPLRRPIEVRDPRDPKIGHLIGLAFQRAWCFIGIARHLPQEDPRRPVFTKLAELHRHAAWTQMFQSGYGGEHWLASFAVFLLTDAGPVATSSGPAPPDEPRR